MTLVVPYLCPIPIGPGSTGLFGIGLRRMVEPLMLKETQGHIHDNVGGIAQLRRGRRYGLAAQAAQGGDGTHRCVVGEGKFGSHGIAQTLGSWLMSVVS